MTTIVGFQGVEHSYSHKAATELVREFGDIALDTMELKPLVSSISVAGALRDKSIDFGVVAIQNTVGGVVKETDEAFISDEWVVKHRYILEIRHCLFVKDDNASLEGLKGVVSHPQALKQCKHTVERLIGSIEEVSYEDTARAAEDLSNGVIQADHAVICSKEAGLANGLTLVSEGVQDNPNNRTEFVLIQKQVPVDPESNEKSIKLFRKLIFDDAFYTGFIKFVSVPFVLLAIPVSSILTRLFPNLYGITQAEMIGLFVGAAFLMVHQFNKYRDAHAIDLLTGYWIYKDEVDSDVKDESQNYAMPRYVIIDSNRDNVLRVRGWLAHTDTSPAKRYFESKNVLHTDLRKRNGSLIYKYSNFTSTKQWAFNGIVELEWSKTAQEVETRNMFGRYYGFLSNTTGGLNFTRISREKFLEECPVELD